jgi:energy-coupling factor transport system permease protein
MVTLLPVYVAVSLVIGSVYAIYLSGVKKYLAGLRLLAILFFIIVIVTPLTNHRGATMLFDSPLGPITLESVVYGICTGGMLITVFIWFQCYQRLITNDKFMFLFGRIAPTSAMIISMIIKFIPVTGQKLKSIMEARKALSAQTDEKQTKMQGIKSGVRTAGILMSRCLEDSIETAEAMRAKGYGSMKRTVFGAQPFRLRDGITVAVVSALFILHITFLLQTSAAASFFPFITVGSASPAVYIVYALMLLWPLLIEAKDGVLWVWRAV